MSSFASPLVLVQSNTTPEVFYETDQGGDDCSHSVSLTSPRDPETFSASEIRPNDYADDGKSDDGDTDSLFKFIVPKIRKERDDAMNNALSDHGYTRTRTIMAASLQGEVFEAECRVPAKGNVKSKVKRVAIKKVCKALYAEHIAIEDGMTFVVDEDVIKESIILNVLTVQHSPPADYICKYIEFFEDQFCFYLVMQYGGDCTLSAFIDAAHRHIAAGRLALREWQKMSKYLFWQVMVAVNWMHRKLHCAHLDLDPSNILVMNGDFVSDDDDDAVHINPRVTLKLCDFGCAEIFRDAQSVRCAKSSLSGRPQYRAPQVYAEETYDAKKADIFQLGLMLYRMAVGAELYQYQDSSLDAAFLCVEEGRIERHLRANKLGRFVNRKLVRLLNAMLSVNEKQRVDSRMVLTHEWFAVYFAKYQHRLEYGVADNTRLSVHFPFYALPQM